MGWGIINIPLSYFKKVTKYVLPRYTSLPASLMQSSPQDAIGPYRPSSCLRNLANADAEGLSPAPKRQYKPTFNTPEHSALLRTFNKDIQLLPPTYHEMDIFNEKKPSAVVFRDILKDAPLTGELQQFHHMDRLNMFAVIPRLNIVVIASQIGRAVVMSLTRLPDTSHNEPVRVSLHLLSIYSSFSKRLLK
jgi:hypothetical protein